jgi:glyoxylase-like metal-dependent hydrolase (beta-lactamase superfamily II)
MNIDEVADKTYRLEAPAPEVNYNFSVYFIKDSRGVLIEPGPASIIPVIKEAMAQLAIKELAYIIPTHIHLDHAGATGSLAQCFPDAKVILHPAGAKHAINPSRLIESTKMAFGDDFETIWGPILPVPEHQVKIPEDGEKLSLEDRQLQIFYAPGHANHHIAIFDLKTKGLFSGEALGTPRPGLESLPLPSAAPPSFDIEAYLNTIEMLGKLEPQIIFYAHNGIGRKPKEIIQEVAKNTRIVGDIILKAMREGEDEESIHHRLQEFAASYLGTNIGEFDIRMVVSGFALYFQKNELV